MEKFTFVRILFLNIAMYNNNGWSYDFIILLPVDDSTLCALINSRYNTVSWLSTSEILYISMAQKLGKWTEGTVLGCAINRIDLCNNQHNLLFIWVFFVTEIWTQYEIHMYRSYWIFYIGYIYIIAFYFKSKIVRLGMGISAQTKEDA